MHPTSLTSRARTPEALRDRIWPESQPGPQDPGWLSNRFRKLPQKRDLNHGSGLAGDTRSAGRGPAAPAGAPAVPFGRGPRAVSGRQDTDVSPGRSSIENVSHHIETSARAGSE